MLPEEKYFRTSNKTKLWQRYCGFLDLSVKEFVDIQNHLLTEQLELVGDSPLARRIMNGNRPKSVEEFRKLVPLTTYENYAPYIGKCQEDELAVKPQWWARTSGRGGEPKWVPYTPKAIEWLGRLGIATVILACASQKGEICIGNNIRFMHNIPPRPYLSGLSLTAFLQAMKVRTIPPMEEYEYETFERKLEAGFKIGLRSGVDVLCSLTSILVRMGEHFTEQSGRMKLSRKMLHPQVAARFIRAYYRSRKEHRPILPKDLWPLKGLMCYGIDTNVYRKMLKEYWGKEPYELYGGTEVGLIAAQTWNKKAMTFVPFLGFLEFIPEDEWAQNLEDKSYRPATVLIDQLEAGKRYEIVVTSLHGMPFLRYRLGDLVRIVSLEDTETDIKLPQMVFECRSDDIIDIGGFTRLDERNIWQAVANTGIKYVDWTARKEYEGETAILRLYLELREDIPEKEVQTRIHEQLRLIDNDYKNLQDMLGLWPLRVKLLPSGSYDRYREARQRERADLAKLRPPHINATEKHIEELVCLVRT